MKFYNKDFNPTTGYSKWLDYIDRTSYYKLMFENTNILLIHLFDYQSMYKNATLESYVAQAMDLNINYIMIEDPHNYPSVPEYAKISPIKTFLLHNDFELYNNADTHRLYWPIWLFFTQDKKDPVPSVTAEYILSSANRNFNHGRPGKIYNYQKLKNKSYFDQILFTKYRTPERLVCPWPYTNIDHEFSEVIDAFIPDFNSWPVLDNDLHEAMAALNLDVYNKSLFHLVAESGVWENLLSEKTYKIFHVGQIPVLCGAKHAVAHLRQLGFDMFDDIVDHAAYDAVDDFKRRIDAMHVVLDNVVTLNHSRLLTETVARRHNNHQWFHSRELTDLVVKSLLDRLLVELN